jgi:type I site-specific restriction endonuclease
MDLNFPKYPFKFKKMPNGIYIFDQFRKKYVKLTPEEWVRQHSLSFLLTEKKVPLCFIAVEKQFIISNQAFRFDALVFDQKGKTLVLIECKASSIAVNQSVADQIFTYNHHIQAPYIFITNGLVHHFYYYSAENKKITELKEFPNFNEMNKM